MAKGGTNLAQLALLVVVGGLGFAASCRGPESSTDYVRRDAVADVLMIVLDRHDAWADRLVELGEVQQPDADRAKRSSALARHLFGSADPTEPVPFPGELPIPVIPEEPAVQPWGLDPNGAWAGER